MDRAALSVGRWGAPLATTAILFFLSACVFDTLPTQPAASEKQPVTNEEPASIGTYEETPLSTAGSLEYPTTTRRRGLGTLTARVPGTETVVGGVHLVSHHVRAVVRDTFARTEIEEEFYNDTSTVLEGRYVFPLPAGASISRLALYVGNTLVEGEMVEKDRAASVFKGIVDDTVRPRDPALLEWVSGGEFSLKIFPMPPRGSRKVILAYDQVLSSTEGRVGYTYPLSLGSDRSNRMHNFTFQLTATENPAQIVDPVVVRYAAELTAQPHKLDVRLAESQGVPESDIVVSYRRQSGQSGVVATYRGSGRGASKAEDSGGFLALRLAAGDSCEEASTQQDRVIVVDRSYSQSRETLALQVALAKELIHDLAEGERFALLACDSACDSFPSQGWAHNELDSKQQALTWLAGIELQGSSDVAGALLEATQLLAERATQLLYLGDGQATSGELSVRSIADRLQPSLRSKQVDLRLVGVGRTTDEVVLAGLARELGATLEPLVTADSRDARISALVRKMRRPVLVSPKVELPAGLSEVYPSELPNLVVGDEVLLVARVSDSFAGGVAKIQGQLKGKTLEWMSDLSMPSEDTNNNPLVPRFWAQARIDQLESEGSRSAKAETVSLSRKYHVMSRATSLLVLENDAMFAAFGIDRTDSKTRLRNEEQFLSRDTLGGGTLSSSASPLSASGAMMGLPIADEYGPDGPVYHGRPPAGSGFGSRHGRAFAVRAPQIRMGATTVSGRFPPALIQRSVRAQYGRFRACYERGLQRNPNLEGRVSVRFVIDRDGAVRQAVNGGSDLPDGDVVACVVNGFRALSFPVQDSGIITVVYPIVFSSDGTRPQRPATQWPAVPWTAPWPPLDPSAGNSGGQYGWAPRVTHYALNEEWRKAGDSRLAQLRKTLGANERSRTSHASLIRGLLSFGRFSEALEASQLFASLDPDLPLARELLAQSLATQGKGAAASAIVDSLTETSPGNAAAQERAAKSYEALGDEKRACAHWRAVSELRSSDLNAQYEALRCRARAQDREQVLARLRALQLRTALLDRLLAEVESGNPPGYAGTSGKAGTFQVSLSCTTPNHACPSLLVVRPDGGVVSTWTPSTARSGLQTLALNAYEGTFRSLVVGGDPDSRGELEVQAYGVVRRFPVVGGEGIRSVAATTLD